MNTERTVHDVASDGTVMVSYVAGDNGQVNVEVQQTSDLHAFLLGWFNTLKTLADGGDVSNWATAAFTIRNSVDGSTHIATGVSPSKPPDKVYTAQGQHLVWTLHCADLQSVTL